MAKSSLPTISIITPSFNQGHFIAETIESVLSQKYSKLEYWVIDGGSTDQTVSILKKYQRHLRWVSEPDKGQTDAINKGLHKVSGEVVAYINSDDTYLPGTLATVGEYFSQHSQAQWLTGDYHIIDEHGKQIQSWVATYKRYWRSKPFFSSLAIANYISQPSTFWRRQVHQQLGEFDQKLRYCMDYDFWLRMIQKYPLHTVPDALSEFRIHSQSKGGSQYIAQFNEEHKVLQRYTRQPFLLGLHWLHAQAVIQAYRRMKG